MNLGKRQPSTGRVGDRIIMLEPGWNLPPLGRRDDPNTATRVLAFAFGTGDHSGLPVGRSITSRPGRP